MRKLLARPSPPPFVDHADPLAVTRAMRAWLSDSHHWTTKALARDTKKGLVDPLGQRSRVASTCVLGAWEYVTGTSFTTYHGEPNSALALFRAVNDGEAPMDINDRLGYEAVLLGLDRVITQLESALWDQQLQPEMETV